MYGTKEGQMKVIIKPKNIFFSGRERGIFACKYLRRVGSFPCLLGRHDALQPLVVVLPLTLVPSLSLILLFQCAVPY